MPKGQSRLCPNDAPRTGKGLRPVNIAHVNEEKIQDGDNCEAGSVVKVLRSDGNSAPLG